MLRQDNHLEILQVSEMLNISVEDYQVMEQGGLTVRLDMLQRIAKAFKVSIAELMKGVEEL